MSWATLYIKQLADGFTVTFRPKGHSMRGIIESGQLCTLEPIDKETELSAGDVVLCRVHGKNYLHLIKAIRSNNTYLIGNNRGGVNGWIGRNKIYGRLIHVE